MTKSTYKTEEFTCDYDSRGLSPSWREDMAAGRYTNHHREVSHFIIRKKIKIAINMKGRKLKVRRV